MKKILVLILTLVLAFGVTAFAGEEGTPGLPGSEGGAQEAGATQAFSRSLDVYGLYQWRYMYTQYKIDGMATKMVSSQLWHTLQAFFTYNISENLMLKFGLAWGSTYGKGRTFAMYDKLTGTSTDNLAYLVRNYEEFPGTTVEPYSASNNWQVVVKQVYMVWKVGPPFGELRIGRLPVVWGFHSICLPSYSGADRIVWVGDMKLGSMRFLPLAIFEIRKDQSAARGDEQLFFALGFIGFAPGKMLEQIWVNVSAFIPTDRVVTKQYATATYAALIGAGGRQEQLRWKVLVFDAYLKLRVGNLLEINFELLGFYGQKGRWVNTGNEDTTAIKWNFLMSILSATINLGTIKITPEFAILTAPDKKVGAGGVVTQDGSAYGWGFFNGNYVVGGQLMNSLTREGQTGAFYASVKAAVEMGKFDAWIKPVIGMTLSKYAPVGGVYVEADSKNLGFEVDLGVGYELADGFRAGFEVYLWLPGKYVKDYEGDYSLKFGLMITLDLKF